jgi:hypothetical protein
MFFMCFTNQFIEPWAMLDAQKSNQQFRLPFEVQAMIYILEAPGLNARVPDLNSTTCVGPHLSYQVWGLSHVEGQIGVDVLVVDNERCTAIL